MIRWSTSSMNNRWGIRLSCLVAVGLQIIGWGDTTAWAALEREPMTLRVVAVNPSTDKSRTVPVRIDLPQEIKPADIMDRGELDIEYDTDRSLYFVHKNDVALAPKQTKIFEVIVRDVWFIPDPELEGLRSQTNLLLKRLESSEYRDAGQQLGDTILARLEEIAQVQNDETIGRKQRIGGYRRNLIALQEIKDDLARMEKLLSFVGSTPVPEILEHSALRSDSPSTTTTWLVIFLIVIFMGLLAGQFFFTWQRRVKASADFSNEQQTAFPRSNAVEAGKGPLSKERES